MHAAILLALAVVSAAPTPAASSLFPTFDGFAISDGPTKYGPDNLYEYINGGADAFIQQDFEELVTATYSNAQKVVVTADLYRHKGPTRAYAMYSQERPTNRAPIPIGIEGYAGDSYVQFVVGAYYVKISRTGPRGVNMLKGFAEKIAAGLPGVREPPAVLKCFPEKGKLPRAEKLSARDFLGHAFLHDGAAVPYEYDGAKFRLFAVQGADKADVQQMLAKYFAAAKIVGPITPEGMITLKDPLNGEVLLAWKGRLIWGAVDEPSKHHAPLVEELGRKLLALGK